MELCHDKEFLCRDTAEEMCEEDRRDTLEYVMTLIKGNGSGTLSRHKGMKIVDELCRDSCKERREGGTTGEIISFFYHAYGEGLDSFIQFCNQL